MCVLIRYQFNYRIGLLFSLLMMQFISLAQQKPILFVDSVFSRLSGATVPTGTDAGPYYIVAWEKTIPCDFKIVRRLDEKMAIITVDNQAAPKLLNKQIRIAPANDRWKLTPGAEKAMEKNSNELQSYILTGFDIDILTASLQNFPVVNIQSIDRPSNTVIVSATGKLLRERLLLLKEVIFVDLRSGPHTEINIIGYNRSFNGINAVDYSIHAANGKNIVVGVKEQKMEETDLDLYKRVKPSTIAAAAITNHATVIASIIGGAGNSYYDGRGIANGCFFFPSSFDNLFADDATILNANNVTVQNHSYGTIVQQFYGAEAVSYDALTWLNKKYIPVFSAGNQGTTSATDGQYANISGYANLTGNFKMAKNVITVGAIDSKGNIPEESSAGPLYDGRIAPQLIALGPNGTSDAAAVVSGAIAVMQQVYADSNSQTIPTASLIKAILYNNADDIYNPGIDYKTGYGQLNSYASVKAIQQKEYDTGTLSSGDSWTKAISVPVNAAQLKVTLAWTDSTAMVNNNKALLNDLDLEVEDIDNGIVYQPWVLNATAHIDSLTKSPIRRRDSLNTAEQVSIQLPAAGNYQLKVSGTDINVASMPFHVNWHIDTLNAFHFTSPQHTSDVNRAEDANLFIRWKTFVADTNTTGNLYISYNRGSSWQPIRSSYKIYRNQYQWPIKDTNSTALLKMETPFGDFLSKEFIISKVTRPLIDFVCTDSFGLSWNKHIDANQYKVFALADSAYLKHVLTVADTFAVMKRSLYPWLVYAVEPVLNNDIPAARSIALDIRLQGTGCFYKTFYYDLQDQNKLNLVLELSAASYVDSVSFEQLTASGQWMKTVGGTSVTGTGLMYHQLVNDPPAGNGYWRARIKLKSGTVLYTEILTVLTTGQRYILFYPNPSSRNKPLVYMLQQGVPANSRLQLFDASGRLLKSFSEMPGNITMPGLAKGLLIYKLMSHDGRLLETGKLIIQ